MESNVKTASTAELKLLSQALAPVGSGAEDEAFSERQQRTLRKEYLEPYVRIRRRDSAAV